MDSSDFLEGAEFERLVDTVRRRSERRRIVVATGDQSVNVSGDAQAGGADESMVVENIEEGITPVGAASRSASSADSGHSPAAADEAG